MRRLRRWLRVTSSETKRERWYFRNGPDRQNVSLRRVHTWHFVRTVKANHTIFSFQIQKGGKYPGKGETHSQPPWNVQIRPLLSGKVHRPRNRGVLQSLPSTSQRYQPFASTWHEDGLRYSNQAARILSLQSLRAEVDLSSRKQLGRLRQRQTQFGMRAAGNLQELRGYPDRLVRPDCS